MFKLLACLTSVAVATFVTAALAFEIPPQVTVEPIVGYEFAHKELPSPHVKGRFFYGARASAGIQYLSAELEATRSNDTETFLDLQTAQTFQTKDTTDRVKLGLKSTYQFTTLLAATARAGCQASRNKHEETRAGVTTTVGDPNKITYKPYGGGSIDIFVTQRTYLSAGISAVFNDFPKMGKNDYQTSLSYAIAFP